MMVAGYGYYRICIYLAGFSLDTKVAGTFLNSRGADEVLVVITQHRTLHIYAYKTKYGHTSYNRSNVLNNYASIKRTLEQHELCSLYPYSYT